MKKEKFLGIITADVVTATEEDSAIHIGSLMEEHNIGVVVIVRDTKVVGIVSERDIARRIVGKGLSPDAVKAKDFMTTEVIAVQIKEGMNKIYQTLCEIPFRHLVILDNDKLVGITSRRDLIDGLTAVRR